ncbi:anti-sigma-factor antagonist [Tolypothrix sp. NIES-4075]|uniref:STAS domain-containing protein n=1 Tax=Tolypothrix sp. NIES-4075 TaxID=2005459 RepID=UPI000B7549B8|nr:STAS domain-containing protein [Tolypothrix sp. NIES-4075]GAX42735.1 anti-sigma-factor antagonist [Tolypothrix sp. NIES-4075]
MGHGTKRQGDKEEFIRFSMLNAQFPMPNAQFPIPNSQLAITIFAMNSRVKVIEPSGILDSVKGNQLSREVSEIVAKKVDIVLIDLKDIKFVDSSGLGALILSMQMVRNANGELFVCSCDLNHILSKRSRHTSGII